MVDHGSIPVVCPILILMMGPGHILVVGNQDLSCSKYKLQLLLGERLALESSLLRCKMKKKK